MNDIFSISRLKLYARKYFTENWRSMVQRTAVMYGVMIIGALVLSASNIHSYDADRDFSMRSCDPSLSDVEVCLALALVGFGCIAASFTGNHCSTSQGRLSDILLPVSVYEKWLVRWTAWCVLFVPIFLIGFEIAEQVRLLYCYAFAENTEWVRHSSLTHMVFDTNEEGQICLSEGFSMCAMVYLAVTSFCCAGSFLWPKGSFVKSFIFGAAIVFTLICIASISNDAVKESYGVDSFGRDMRINILWAVSVISALFFWMLSLLRYREMEVINHW